MPTIRPMEPLTLSAGFEYKQYKFQTTSLRLVSSRESVTATNAYAGLQSIPISSYSQPATLSGSGVNAPAGSTTSWITPSVSAAQAIIEASIARPGVRAQRARATSATTPA